MKILEASISGESMGRVAGMEGAYNRILTRLTRRIEQLVCNYDYLVPDGWRAIVMERSSSHLFMPRLYLDIQSNRGGGDYAKVKLETLKFFSEEVATRPVDGKELARMAEQSLSVIDADRDNKLLEEPSTQKILKQIWRRSDPNELPEHIWEWLRDQCHVTACYGGIKVPYEALNVKAQPAIQAQVKDDAGELLIAFSGASAEQDLMFATGILCDLLKAYKVELPLVQTWYNLRGLKKIPAVRLWLDIWGIQEA